MKVYNSLTNKKEEFISLNPREVRMYVCGVTVYDVCHIGHARASFAFDVVRKYLKYKGYRVVFVRNVTDVDDKIINKAAKESSEDLVSAVQSVSQKYNELYHKDMQDLGIEEPDIEPKATGHIHDMISMIEQLIAKDMAYAVDGNVYFSVKSYEKYGALSNQKIDEMEEGARVEVEETKRDSLDFALWKKAKETEPYWDSPWGKGRPGWHIECSVMSTKYLGKTFDIHAGGRDLIFPHHENEIAQACCATGGEFAKYWLHNGLLTINGEKMAKSLGNFFTIQDILTQYPDPDILKIFFLHSHYSSAVDYTEDKMKEAQIVKKKFMDFFTRVDQLEIEPFLDERTEFTMEKIYQEINQFEQVMDDDFNTPKALAVLFDLLNKLNKTYSGIGKVCEADYLKMSFAAKTIKQLGGLLGLFAEVKESVDNKAEGTGELIATLISARKLLREKKNFEAADIIRDEIGKAGYVFEDLKDGKTIIKKTVL